MGCRSEAHGVASGISEVCEWWEERDVRCWLHVK